MPNTSFQSSALKVAALAVVLLAGSTASLADQRGQDATSDKDVLRGPKVESPNVPGVDPMFTMTEDRFSNGAQEIKIPHRVYVRAIMSLNPRAVGDDLALTAEQGKTLREIERGYLEQVREYFAEHRDEMAELIPQADIPMPRGARGGEAGQRGERAERGERARPDVDAERPARGERRARLDADSERPARDRAGQRQAQGPGQGRAGTGQQFMERMFAALGRLEPSNDPNVQAARERLLEIRKGAPKPDDAHARMWTVLNENQQAHVTAQIDRYKAQVEKRRAERMKAMAEGQQPDSIRERRPEADAAEAPKPERRRRRPER